MEEYIFKGKSKATGEWVEGYLIPGINSNKGKLYIWQEAENDIGYTEVEVIPETVGIYTGVNDESGQRIYRGDIVAGYSGSGFHLGEVKFDEVRGAFYVDTARFDQNQYNYNSDSLVGDWDIRGNVHDRFKGAGNEE